MTQAWRLLALATVLATAGLAQGAAGHAAPEPLANEVKVLVDDAQDEFYWYDGYDLYQLHVREAHWSSLDETGVVLRFTLYGGFAPAGAADALHVDVHAEGASGTETVRFTTTDDRNWTSETGEVLFTDVTEEDPPWTGVTSRMQVLIPYDALGARPGDTVSGISMDSYADADLRDEAPGGIYVPNSGGRAEVPVESKRLVDELELTGPSGYLNVSLETDGSEAVLGIENALANGQHVSVEATPTPGWNASYVGASQASLDPNGSVELRVNATASPTASQPLPVTVTSDLGALRTYYLGVNGTAIETGLEAASVDVAPERPANESPGFTAALALVGLGLALVLPRRREA